MITSNDLVEPVIFPMGPIATIAERNLLLSQRAEEANIQMITEKCKRRRKTNSNPKKPKTNSTSKSNVESTNSESTKKTSNKQNKKRKIVSSDESSENESLEDELSIGSEENDNTQNEKNEEINSSGDCSGSEDSEYEIDKFTYLKNKLHYDEEDKTIYKTTRIVEENGYLVVYRKKQYSNGKFAAKEDRSPIFAKDVVEYTKAYDNRMQLK